MAEYTIKIDIPNAADIRRIVNAEVFTRVAQAVRNIAEVAAEDWRTAVYNAKLWMGEKAPYMKSITVSLDLPFRATVSSSYKYAEEIETGRPPKDLKRMLQTSKKVRFVKHGPHAGQRYLIIPMRHNVKDMPEDVAAQAGALSPSRVTGTRLQHNGGTGARVRMRQRATYNWGDRLPAGQKNKNYDNMVRFDSSSKKAKSSVYLTFRLMGEWSTGWVTSAKPGMYIAQKVATDLQPFADRVIAASFDAA
jgi:hypothetical protein